MQKNCFLFHGTRDSRSMNWLCRKVTPVLSLISLFRSEFGYWSCGFIKVRVVHLSKLSHTTSDYMINNCFNSYLRSRQLIKLTLYGLSHAVLFLSAHLLTGQHRLFQVCASLSCFKRHLKCLVEQQEFLPACNKTLWTHTTFTHKRVIMTELFVWGTAGIHMKRRKNKQHQLYPVTGTSHALTEDWASSLPSRAEGLCSLGTETHLLPGNSWRVGMTLC